MNVSVADGRRTVNINQACDLAGVSRRTIYNWLAMGKLDYARVPSGSIRIYVDSLLKPQPKPVAPVENEGVPC